MFDDARVENDGGGDTGTGSDGGGTSSGGSDSGSDSGGGSDSGSDSGGSSGGFVVPPAPAAAAGYTVNTFSTPTFTTTPGKGGVDIHGTQASGYGWYHYNINGGTIVTLGDVAVNGDGSMQLNGNANGQEIATAACVGGDTSHPCQFTDFVGTAFGGGAYFEFTAITPNTDCCTDPNNVLVTGKLGWPIFTAYTLEGAATFANNNCTQPGFDTGYPCNHWPGEEDHGFNNQFATDWFENHYGRLAPAVHETFGVYGAAPNGSCGKTKTGDYCQNISSLAYAQTAGMNLQQVHQYGALWIPVGTTNSAGGSCPSNGGCIQYYIDRVLQQGTTGGSSYGQSWTQWVNTVAGGALTANPAGSLPPFCGRQADNSSCPNPPWRFGGLDFQHLVPVAGAGTAAAGVGGTSAGFPVIIYDFEVWQSTGNNNLRK